MLDDKTRDRALILLDFIVSRIKSSSQQVKSARAEFGDLLDKLNAAPDHKNQDS